MLDFKLSASFFVVNSILGRTWNKLVQE